ncbi:mitogen-activated protein kinase kinase kinase 18-like [Coffea arabica]|uniref:Mitogen-activated protein kinase kinase kinase 18-like n=1 Tax=Coffea arabica TaxID=13443 RepID=A0A6P6TDF8_COFAR|nr:mitogen-activated protein kinase kinase kinase 18-like [Coffea arabica]
MGCWTRGPIIGRGSSATVSLATTASGELLAVKSADLSCSSLLQKEKSLISELSSPYIVKYVGCDVTTENDKPLYNLLMEYVPGGTLSDQIRKQGGPLEESMIQVFAHQILQGLDYLHLKGIVHCDIKGQNVLIGRDGAKIGDLGCARMVEEGNGMAGKSVISGTPMFMAPEVARGEEQGFAADIWALGCTIIEVATGNNPWPDMEDPVSALYRIGYSGDVPEFPWWLSDSANEFLSKCLKRDAKKRWTARELLHHPFFHGVGEEKEAEFVRNSPTTVLDQGFWDSMEVAESSLQDSSHIVSSLGSPADRIKNLMGNLFSTNANFPNWSEDGDWVTVRGTDSQEIQPVSQQNENSEVHDSQLAMDPFLYSIDLEEELESSIVIDDLLINCLVDEISNVGNVSGGLNLTLSCDNVEETFNFLAKILDFDMNIMKCWFLINSILSEAHVFLCLLYFKVSTYLMPLTFNQTLAS